MTLDWSGKGELVAHTFSQCVLTTAVWGRCYFTHVIDEESKDWKVWATCLIGYRKWQNWDSDMGLSDFKPSGVFMTSLDSVSLHIYLSFPLSHLGERRPTFPREPVDSVPAQFQLQSPLAPLCIFRLSFSTNFLPSACSLFIAISHLGWVAVCCLSHSSHQEPSAALNSVQVLFILETLQSWVLWLTCFFFFSLSGYSFGYFWLFSFFPVLELQATGSKSVVGSRLLL